MFNLTLAGYNETSEDTFEIPTGTSINTDFLKTTPYCDPSSNLPGNNAATNEQTGPGTGWDPKVVFIFHCNPPEHRYISAQTIINGFLNQERLRGTSTILDYLTGNFQGSLGDPRYLIWGHDDGCTNLPTDSAGHALTYGQALHASRGTALTWLSAYLDCQLNPGDPSKVSSASIALYNEIVPRIMNQIDLAAADFLNPDRYTYDPSNGAFHHKEFGIVCVDDCFPNGAYKVAIGNVLQDDVNRYYDLHITQLKYITPYGLAVLRPVLRTERAKTYAEIAPKIFDVVSYSYVGYQWISISYEHAANEADQRHVPR